MNSLHTVNTAMYLFYEKNYFRLSQMKYSKQKYALLAHMQRDSNRKSTQMYSIIAVYLVVIT